MARMMRSMFSFVERSGSVSSMRRDEGAAHRTRERPVVDGGARATDVQLHSSGTGEANSNLTHDSSNPFWSGGNETVAHLVSLAKRG